MNYTDRKEIPDKYKWDLSLLIADESTWQPRLDAVQKEFAKLAEYKGRLSNPQVLLDFSKLNDKIGLELETLLVYANMKSHEDIRCQNAHTDSSGFNRNIFIRVICEIRG